MAIIIPLLLSIIKYLNKILFKFQCFLIHRFMSNLPSDNPIAEQYRTMQVDDFPIIEKRELLDHKVLLQQYLDTHGKPLKPINHRSSNLPPKGTTCPICNAPYEYIYDNSGGRGQLNARYVTPLSSPTSPTWKKWSLNALIADIHSLKNEIEKTSLSTHAKTVNAHSISKTLLP